MRNFPGERIVVQMQPLQLRQIAQFMGDLPGKGIAPQRQVLQMREVT